MPSYMSSCALAEEASFSAFMNCYLREVNAGTWRDSASWCEENNMTLVLEGQELIELHLPFGNARIALDIIYRSIVGRHHFANVYLQYLGQGGQRNSWHKVDLMFVLFLVVREIYQAQAQRLQKQQPVALNNSSESGSHYYYDKIKKNEQQLLARLIESYQLLTQYIEINRRSSTGRAADAQVNRAIEPTALHFIDSEQLALYGHWLHPIPKSRQGISWWQQSHYSPELNGRFQLHYFAVDSALVNQGSILPQQASELILAELTRVTPVEVDAKKILLPVHPLQAQFLLLQGPVKKLLATGALKYLGGMGAEYTPTTSVRTVFNTESECMFKFSIPVRITNSLRTNRKHELRVGTVVEKFMRKSGFCVAHPEFRIIDDPAYVTVNIEGMEESGFEVILRRNIFRREQGIGICSVLTLVQAPIHGAHDQENRSLLQTLIFDLAEKEQRPVADVAMEWFSRYWHCAIESLILLYDQHGIALEAHQQNSLLDVSQGYPSCYYYRDNQGFYLSNDYREAFAKIEPEMLTITQMYYDDRVTFEGISYYMFINQLFSVIYRLGADGIIEEQVLIEKVKCELKCLLGKLSGVGKRFVEHILNEKQLSYKTNLLARVHDIDELHEGMERAVYACMDNPLYEPDQAATQSRDADLEEAEGKVKYHVA